MFGKVNKAMLAVATVPMTVLSTLSVAFASSSSSSTGVSSTDIASILTVLQKQISVASVVEILAYVIGAGIGLVFMWWAGRKLIRTFMSAFRRGKLSA